MYELPLDQARHLHTFYLTILLSDSLTRDRPRLFDQVGHQTTNAYIGNKHFSLNNDLVKLTKIMNNLVKDLKILSFSHFSVSKIGGIFPKRITMKNISLGDQLLLMKFFENFDF